VVAGSRISMSVSIEGILESLASALNAMPDVFSTPQWGGRAYKLPGPGSRGKRKPVLLTHVTIPKQRDCVRLGFRLDLQRARAVVKQHTFIKPSTFGTLGKNGWLETAITTKAQCRIVIDLLKESRALHPVSEPAATRGTRSSTPTRKKSAGAQGNAEAMRIDAVLRRKRDEGWTLQDDDFDDRPS
jgi:hypothetical protein